MNKKNNTLEFTMEKTDTGFSAFSKNYPIYTTGSSISELRNNIVEAANLYFEDLDQEIDVHHIDIQVDIQQFFKYYRVINAKFLAQRINMNESLLSQYVQGHKKPSKKQTERIIKGLNEIGEELASIILT